LKGGVKYVVLLGDGMADRPIRELDGKTPLMAARTPNMDDIARRGILGTVRTIPEGMPPGSDVANLSVMGYDPAEVYTGRSPLEAAGIGVELGPEDIAFRCNLVTLGWERDGGLDTDLGGSGFCGRASLRR
jgi:2,3-bisphosphoglycerate-independent phosphoglycerate mutase